MEAGHYDCVFLPWFLDKGIIKDKTGQEILFNSLEAWLRLWSQAEGMGASATSGSARRDLQ